MKLYKIKTCFGTWISCAADGTIIHCAEPEYPMIFESADERIFVGQSLLVGGLILNVGSNVKRRSQTLILEALVLDSKTTIRDPLSKKLLCAVPDLSIIANRSAAGDWETYSIIQFDEPEVVEKQSISVPAGIEWMIAVGNNNVKNVATDVLLHSAFYPNTSSYLLDDQWGQSLGGLMSLIHSSSQNSPRSIIYDLQNSNLDFLEGSGSEGNPATYAHAVSQVVRRRAVPRKKLCIVASARNEGVYLLEWICYHLGLGVDHIFLYTNDNDDGSDELINAIIPFAPLTWIPSAATLGLSPQYRAFGHAFGIMPDILEFDWTLVIDLDEFLVLDVNVIPDIEKLISNIDVIGANTCSIPWRVMGPSEMGAWSTDSLFSRFRKSWHEARPHVKSLSKTRFVTHSQPHFPHFPDGINRHTVTPLGIKLDQKEKSLDSLSKPLSKHSSGAEIFHFWHKSAEEFLYRRSSSLGGQSFSKDSSMRGDLAQKFLADYRAGTELKSDIVDRLEGISAGYLKRLRSVDSICRAESKVRALYENKAKSIVDTHLANENENIRSLAEIARAARVKY